MKAPLRVLTMLGITCALLPMTAATSHAAGSTATTDCVTASETRDFGRGEISVCPQGDGTYRATGWVEDLLPGDGAFGGPDGGCVSWALSSAHAYETFTTMACPHFSGPATVQIDDVITPAHPITKAQLTTLWF
ncbi:hypothetical protein [Streptomyces pseudovenezuelae]|uniref:Secreted protein n=1 Tax=Streptomyces pseudovenezuelae TaxID=67350 RepID=A0ABT6LF61_9ACTN|nr:hypothetical protein [Streptomyces pseudovenezuelae]MDH6214944.1 hypothetical protein [Streptomyces pseudovenezuelae]